MTLFVASDINASGAKLVLNMGGTIYIVMALC